LITRASSIYLKKGKEKLLHCPKELIFLFKGKSTSSPEAPSIHLKFTPARNQVKKSTNFAKNLDEKVKTV
jgi:hypothetical protein